MQRLSLDQVRALIRVSDVAHAAPMRMGDFHRQSRPGIIADLARDLLDALGEPHYAETAQDTLPLGEELGEE